MLQGGGGFRIHLYHMQLTLLGNLVSELTKNLHSKNIR